MNWLGMNASSDEYGKLVLKQLGGSIGTQINVTDLMDNMDITYNTDIIDSGNVKLDDYSLVNLLAKYELYENTNLKLRIENIFNNSYQVIDKFGTSPRAFYLSIDNAF